jgi:hypothetical protein
MREMTKPHPNDVALCFNARQTKSNKQIKYSTDFNGGSKLSNSFIRLSHCALNGKQEKNKLLNKPLLTLSLEEPLALSDKIGILPYVIDIRLTGF